MCHSGHWRHYGVIMTYCFQKRITLNGEKHQTLITDIFWSSSTLPHAALPVNTLEKRFPETLISVSWSLQKVAPKYRWNMLYMVTLNHCFMHRKASQIVERSCGEDIED